MKLALVSPYDFPYPGGVTEHVASLAEQLRRHGHQVHIIAPSSADAHTRRSIPWFHPIGGVLPVPASGSTARISLRGYRHVKTLLQAERFDLIHIHEPMVPALSLAVLRHSDTVNVATFHAGGRPSPLYLYGTPILKPFFARLHGRIAVSRAARDLVATRFGGDYRVIPNGIDFQHFSTPRRRLPHLADGKLNVLFVGRLEKRKGLTYLFSAWERLRAQVPDARLVVVGGGRALQRYRAHMAGRGWDEVVMAGCVSREELPAYYHSCDVFCAPSTGQESFGMVLLEAMAAGRPIVTSDIPGYREVVSHERQALLVPPRDETALADALIALLRRAELRARLGGQGPRTARRYAWDRVGADVLEYYCEIMERLGMQVGQARSAPGKFGEAPTRAAS